MKRLLVYCFAASIIFTGCVSTKTYKAATDESEARLKKFEKVSEELDAEKKAYAKLKTEMEDIIKAKNSDINGLKSQLDELSSKGIMTSREIEELKKEKARLSETDKAKGTELANVKSELSKMTEEASALKGQIEALAKEKARLAESEDTRGKELTLVKGELEKQAGEKDYLSRELERLKMKSGEISTEKEKEIANVKNAYENLVKELKQEIEKGDIKITQAVDRLSVNMVEKILFDSGEAELKPEGLKVMKRVGDILKNIKDKQIRVEGYTDNVQIGAKIRKKYPSNWELSTARATNVVRYLQDKAGVDPKMLSAAGLADNKPVAVNDTPEGRAQNRRIEIVLLPLDADKVLQELKQ